MKIKCFKKSILGVHKSIFLIVIVFIASYFFLCSEVKGILSSSPLKGGGGSLEMPLTSSSSKSEVYYDDDADIKLYASSSDEEKDAGFTFNTSNIDFDTINTAFDLDLWDKILNFKSGKINLGSVYLLKSLYKEYNSGGLELSSGRGFWNKFNNYLNLPDRDRSLETSSRLRKMIVNSVESSYLFFDNLLLEYISLFTTPVEEFRDELKQFSYSLGKNDLFETGAGGRTEELIIENDKGPFSNIGDLSFNINKLKTLLEENGVKFNDLKSDIGKKIEGIKEKLATYSSIYKNTLKDNIEYIKKEIDTDITDTIEGKVFKLQDISELENKIRPLVSKLHTNIELFENLGAELLTDDPLSMDKIVAAKIKEGLENLKKDLKEMISGISKVKQNLFENLFSLYYPNYKEFEFKNQKFKSRNQEGVVKGLGFISQDDNEIEVYNKVKVLSKIVSENKLAELVNKYNLPPEIADGEKVRVDYYQVIPEKIETDDSTWLLQEKKDNPERYSVALNITTLVEDSDEVREIEEIRIAPVRGIAEGKQYRYMKVKKKYYLEEGVYEVKMYNDEEEFIGGMRRGFMPELKGEYGKSILGHNVRGSSIGVSLLKDGKVDLGENGFASVMTFYDDEAKMNEAGPHRFFDSTLERLKRIDNNLDNSKEIKTESPDGICGELVMYVLDNVFDEVRGQEVQDSERSLGLYRLFWINSPSDFNYRNKEIWKEEIEK